MITHDILLAGRTMVFSATMVFFFSLGRVDDFVTRRAFPPRFAFRSSILFRTTFPTGTSCDIFDTLPVLPFWDSPSFYTRCRSLRTRVSLCGRNVSGRTNKSISTRKILSHWKWYGNGNRRPSTGRRTVPGRYSDS